MSRQQKPNINSKEDYNNAYKEKMSKVIADRIRQRISKIIKAKSNGKKQYSTTLELGCDRLYLMDYLENLFEDGMTWENYGEWHIDHIKPLSIFDLTLEEDFKQAVHYTNLQPLWAKDNMSKGNKDFIEWRNK